MKHTKTAISVIAVVALGVELTSSARPPRGVVEPVVIDFQKFNFRLA
jgi:hypothetical protein